MAEFTNQHNHLTEFQREIELDENLNTLQLKIEKNSTQIDSSQISIQYANNLDIPINLWSESNVYNKQIRTPIMNPIYLKSCTSPHPLQTFELITFLLNQLKNPKYRVDYCPYCQSAFPKTEEELLNNIVINKWLQKKLEQISFTHQNLYYFSQSNIFLSAKIYDELNNQQKESLKQYLNGQQPITDQEYKDPVVPNPRQNHRIFCQNSQQIIHIPVYKETDPNQHFDLIQLIKKGLLENNLVFDNTLYHHLIKNPEFFLNHAAIPYKDKFFYTQEYQIFNNLFFEELNVQQVLLQFCTAVFHDKGDKNQTQTEIFYRNKLNPNYKDFIISEKIYLDSQNQEQNEQVQIEIPVRCKNCTSLQVIELRKCAAYLYYQDQKGLIVTLCPLCEQPLQKIQGYKNNGIKQDLLLQYANNFYVDLRILTQALGNPDFQGKYSLKLEQNQFEINESRLPVDQIIAKNPLITYEDPQYSFMSLNKLVFRVNINCLLENNQILKIPIKSKYCNHKQRISCIDQANYIQQIEKHQVVRCPECDIELKPEDMQQDMVMKDILMKLRQADKNENNVIFDMGKKQIQRVDKEFIRNRQLKKELDRKFAELNQKKQGFYQRIKTELEDQKNKANQQFANIKGIRATVSEKQVREEYERRIGVRKKDEQIMIMNNGNQNKNSHLNKLIHKKLNSQAQQPAMPAGFTVKKKTVIKQYGDVVNDSQSNQQKFNEKIEYNQIDKEMQETEQKLKTLAKFLKKNDIEYKIHQQNKQNIIQQIPNKSQEKIIQEPQNTNFFDIPLPEQQQQQQQPNNMNDNFFSNPNTVQQNNFFQNQNNINQNNNFLKNNQDQNDNEINNNNNYNGNNNNFFLNQNNDQNQQKEQIQEEQQIPQSYNFFNASQMSEILPKKNGDGDEPMEEENNDEEFDLNCKTQKNSQIKNSNSNDFFAIAEYFGIQNDEDLVNYNYNQEKDGLLNQAKNSENIMKNFYDNQEKIKENTDENMNIFPNQHQQPKQNVSESKQNPNPLIEKPHQSLQSKVPQVDFTMKNSAFNNNSQQNFQFQNQEQQPETYKGWEISHHTKKPQENNVFNNINNNLQQQQQYQQQQQQQQQQLNDTINNSWNMEHQEQNSLVQPAQQVIQNQQNYNFFASNQNDDQIEQEEEEQQSQFSLQQNEASAFLGQNVGPKSESILLEQEEDDTQKKLLGKQGRRQKKFQQIE